MPPAEQAGHDGLSDARREPGRDRGVGGRAALDEDLDAGGHGRRMPCGDARRQDWSPAFSRGIASQPMRPIPRRGKSSRWLISPPPAYP
jgi:hypothetical protein